MAAIYYVTSPSDVSLCLYAGIDATITRYFDHPFHLLPLREIADLRIIPVRRLEFRLNGFVEGFCVPRTVGSTHGDSG